MWKERRVETVTVPAGFMDLRSAAEINCLLADLKRNTHTPRAVQGMWGTDFVTKVA